MNTNVLSIIKHKDALNSLEPIRKYVAQSCGKFSQPSLIFTDIFLQGVKLSICGFLPTFTAACLCFHPLISTGVITADETLTWRIVFLIFKVPYLSRSPCLSRNTYFPHFIFVWFTIFDGVYHCHYLHKYPLKVICSLKICPLLILSRKYVAIYPTHSGLSGCMYTNFIYPGPFDINMVQCLSFTSSFTTRTRCKMVFQSTKGLAKQFLLDSRSHFNHSFTSVSLNAHEHTFCPNNLDASNPS